MRIYSKNGKVDAYASETTEIGTRGVFLGIIRDSYKKEEICGIREAVKSLYYRSRKDGTTLYGHGTDRGAAKSILQEGLYVSYGHLETTSIPLFGHLSVLRSQERNMIKILLNWPYLYMSGAIVVFELPNPKEGGYGGLPHCNSFLKYNTEKKVYILPQDYIIGYFDTREKKFVGRR